MPTVKESGFLNAIDRLLDRGVLVHLSILALLGFITYFNTIGFPFVHDDVVFIQQNPNIHRWDNIGDAFFRPAIPQFFQGLVTPYYRPVLEVIYRLEYAIFGMDPHGFHLFNILLHILNGFLVYRIIRHVFGSVWTSVAAAAVFLVHPVQTEAAACISGISNLACALFMLLALDGYLRAQTVDVARRSVWFLYSLLMFAVALLTKEQALMLIGIIGLHDLLLARDRRIPVIAGRWMALGLILLIYLGVRHSLFGGLTSAVFENIGELKLRLLSLPRLLELYGGLVLFPMDLHYYRSIDILGSNGLSWALLVFMTAGLGLGLRRLAPEDRAKVCWGLGWFLLSLLPVLNIVPLVNEYSFLAAAEHNLYFPIIGFLIFVCAGISALRLRMTGSRIIVGKTLIVVLIGVMSVASLMQNRFWRSETELFRRALQFEPQLGRVHILLAKAYFKEGKFPEAIKEYQLAEAIMQGYAAKAASEKALRFYQGMLKGIYSDSAQSYAGIRDFASAIQRYDRALALDPRDSYVYSNRALSFIAQGNMAQGIQDLEKALELNPDNLLAANNMSICLIQTGQLAKARDLLEEIVRKDPGFTAARDNLEKLNRSQGIKP